MKVFLYITSYIGLSMGAQHYYGELQPNDYNLPTIQLTRVLTPRQAARANRYRDEQNILNAKAGDTSEGFDEVDEIIELAQKTWLNHFPNGTILLKGKTSWAEPQLILDWPGHDEAKEKANEIFAEFDKIDGYANRKNDKIADALDRRWSHLLEESTTKKHT